MILPATFLGYAALSTLIGFVLLYVIRYYASRGFNTPPGPLGIPLLGYAPFLGKYPWKKYAELKETYGDVFSLYLNSKFTVVLGTYDAIRAAFIDQERNFQGRGENSVTEYLASGKDGRIHGIIQLEGAKWDGTHDFIVETIKELGVNKEPMEALIFDELDYLCKRIGDKGTNPFDPMDFLQPATMNVVGRVCFGRRFDYDDNEMSRPETKAKMAAEFTAGSFLMSIRRLLPQNMRRRLIGSLHNFNTQWDVIEEEIENHQKNFQETRIRDFIDAYFRHVEGKDDKSPLAFISKDDLVTTIEVMFNAGPEATAVGLQFAILHLCHNPDVQARVQEELDQVIGRDRPITMADRVNLPYTIATFFEFLRLSGINPLGVPRSNFEETELFGFRIPKRSEIIPNIWGAHRDPKYFPNPTVFNPERFLDENGKVNIPPQFILFSMGKRSCPGQELARMLVFLMFANLFHRFQFGAAQGETLPSTEEYGPGDVTFRSLPYKVEVTPRLRVEAA